MAGRVRVGRGTLMARVAPGIAATIQSFIALRSRTMTIATYLELRTTRFGHAMMDGSISSRTLLGARVSVYIWQYLDDGKVSAV